MKRMHHIIKGLLLTSFYSVLATASTNEHGIEVTITGTDGATGQIIAALYDSKDSYMKTSVLELVSPAGGDRNVVLDFGNHGPGDYAVVVIYDKNNNGKLDTGLFRIPTEKVGFSNNAPIRFGPAKWKAAKFSVIDGDVKTNIDLKLKRG